MTDKIYATISESAKITGLSVCFLRAGVKSGRFPSIKVGNRAMVCLPGLLDVLSKEQRITKEE